MRKRSNNSNLSRESKNSFSGSINNSFVRTPRRSQDRSTINLTEAKQVSKEKIDHTASLERLKI